MRNLLLIIFCFLGVNAVAQNRKTYTTTSAEWIFSYATTDINGSDKGTRLRFSPVFNVQTTLNKDLGRKFGLFSGIAVRNIGLIYDVPNSSEKKKFRSYNIGIPFGFKLGNVNKTYLIGGYELELPVNYKEKTFIDERKVDKFNVWFSKRTPPMMHSVFLGFQTSKGTSIKFKYYMSNFFNEGFQSTDHLGNLYKPFQNFEAHVFYVSLSFTVLKNRKLNPAIKKKPEPVYEAVNSFGY